MKTDALPESPDQKLQNQPGSTVSTKTTDKTCRLTYDAQQVNVNEPLVNHFLLQKAHYQI